MVLAEKDSKRLVNRHGRACPGHPRLPQAVSQDVDARHKAGHDELQMSDLK